MELSLNPCSDDTAARAGVHGDGVGTSKPLLFRRAMSLPVASSMPACSDMALSCPAWAKGPCGFRVI